MHRKRKMYFDSGTLSVWMADPRKRTIAVHDRDADQARLYRDSDVIELQEILPGFRLSLAELFGELDEMHGRPASS
jgi:Uma2 family endonuclease